MRLSSQDHGPVTVLTIEEPRFDANHAETFRDQVRELVGKGPDIYVIDLSHVVFIDSSGVGALVGLLKFVGREKRLELCGLTPTVHKVFKLTRLDTVFIISGSVRACLRSHGAEIARAAG